jgi:hypothetical protein
MHSTEDEAVFRAGKSKGAHAKAGRLFVSENRLTAEG